jgi:hypothetical protein
MHDSRGSGVNSCRHREYFMTCEQFDELLNRSGGCCELCGRPGVETSHGQLYIDHDKWRGMWAARGLLCGRCNSMLQHETDFTKGVEAYLQNSWFKGMLAALGVDDSPPEPAPGIRVTAGQSCNWHRGEDGWHCTCGRHRRTRHIPVTWTYILRSFGPHRIRIHGRAIAPP